MNLSSSELIRNFISKLEEISLPNNTLGVKYEDFLKHLYRDLSKETEFKRWFNGSKVVDSANRPLIV